MARKFNITGTCIPERHFMSDMAGKLDKVMEMVRSGDYFTINRPRQYGKTTIMYLLEKQLQKDKDYLAIDISFESIDSPTYQKHNVFIPTVLNILKRRLAFMGEKDLAAMIAANNELENFDQLNAFFTDFVAASGRRVILMIDEVDKAGNNQLFLDFLGMLRAKYLKMVEGKDYSFYSVILAGVHDVKTLKARIRSKEKRVYNSPWNIAVDFNVDMELTPAEITPVLEAYQRERGIKIDIPFFAEKLFYFTSGYPFLVSFLCKIIDEEIMTGSKVKEWQPHHLVQAVQIALDKDATNFQVLIQNMEDNPELYDIVFNIIMNAKDFTYNRRNKVMSDGTIHGIIRSDKGKARVHNRLYERLIYDYLSSNLEISICLLAAVAIRKRAGSAIGSK